MWNVLYSCDQYDRATSCLEKSRKSSLTNWLLHELSGEGWVKCAGKDGKSHFRQKLAHAKVQSRGILWKSELLELLICHRNRGKGGLKGGRSYVREDFCFFAKSKILYFYLQVSGSCKTFFSCDFFFFLSKRITWPAKE